MAKKAKEKKGETKYKQTEIGLIPEDWGCKSIGEVGEVCMCKRVMKEQTTTTGLIPFYKIGTFGREPDAYISEELFTEYKNKYSYPHKGDILVSAAGTIGRTVIFDGEPSYFQDSNIVWIDNDEKLVINKFLFYVYSTIEWNTSETTIKRLYNDNFKKLLFPIPPLPEQQAIASALTSVDNLIASLDKLIAKTQSVKQGAMQQLLTGKTRLKGFNELWGTYKIDDLFDIGNGYTPSKANPQYWANGTIPWFRLEDIRKNGRILNDSIQHITPLAIKSGKLFPPDSYILSTTATIGEHALITVASLSNQQFSILLKKPNRKDIIDTIYFFYYLYIIGDWCRNNINAGGLNAVNIEDLKNLEFFAPSSIEEQRAIASALTAIDDQISALEAKRKKYEMVKVGMMQQLLTGKIRLK